MRKNNYRRKEMVELTNLDQEKEGTKEIILLIRNCDQSDYRKEMVKLINLDQKKKGTKRDHLIDQ
jgi:hypothetical protein